MKKNAYFYLVAFTTILAFVVVLLGAYTRLKGAGLGCPDWPGCYGHITVPTSQTALAFADKAYPTQPVEADKAWIEMVHRYFAGSLALLTIIIAGIGFFRRKNYHLPIVLPILLFGLIFFQAALGAWTVTLKLMPMVVMGHLLGGFTLFSLLLLTSMIVKENKREKSASFSPGFKTVVFFGFVIVCFQVALGAWTSTNYAALVCPGFPLCHGMSMPVWDIKQAFQWWKPFEDVSYEGKMTIQMFHRIGGVLTILYLFILTLVTLRLKKATGLRSLMCLIISLVTLQFILGILNVALLLPLPIAVMHNGVACLLMGSMLTLTYWVIQKRQ
jgi:cytochrome c oxidase assembly protein subunit 15